MSQNQSVDPLPFSGLEAIVDGYPWRPEVEIEPIGSPQRIAPHARAVAADVVVAGDEVGNGRLVLLHDPAGNTAWHGTHRVVSFVRAQVDVEMATDPLLPQVGWSWLEDSLASHAAQYHSPSGTVTQVVSKGFGELADETDRAEVEIRASWTPVLEGVDDLALHLSAWQDLLCQVSGLPPMAPGLATLQNKGRNR